MNRMMRGALQLLKANPKEVLLRFQFLTMIKGTDPAARDPGCLFRMVFKYLRMSWASSGVSMSSARINSSTVRASGRKLDSVQRSFGIFSHALNDFECQETHK